jgi:hypothetical protein
MHWIPATLVKSRRVNKRTWYRHPLSTSALTSSRISQMRHQIDTVQRFGPGRLRRDDLSEQPFQTETAIQIIKRGHYHVFAVQCAQSVRVP